MIYDIAFERLLSPDKVRREKCRATGTHPIDKFFNSRLSDCRNGTCRKLQPDNAATFLDNAAGNARPPSRLTV